VLQSLRTYRCDISLNVLFTLVSGGDSKIDFSCVCFVFHFVYVVQASIIFTPNFYKYTLLLARKPFKLFHTRFTKRCSVRFHSKCLQRTGHTSKLKTMCFCAPIETLGCVKRTLLLKVSKFRKEPTSIFQCMDWRETRNTGMIRWNSFLKG